MAIASCESLQSGRRNAGVRENREKPWGRSGTAVYFKQSEEKEEGQGGWEDKPWQGHVASLLPREKWNKVGTDKRATRGKKMNVWNTREVSLPFCLLLPCVLPFIPTCFSSLLILKVIVNQSFFSKIMFFLKVVGAEILCSLGQPVLFQRSLCDLAACHGGWVAQVLASYIFQASDLMNRVTN